ncbi:hypothetical protein [Methylocystis parvus]|nr:hypothetical protein [Methylocystis parvus]
MRLIDVQGSQCAYLVWLLLKIVLALNQEPGASLDDPDGLDEE